jgi:hypothetical protein
MKVNLFEGFVKTIARGTAASALSPHFLYTRWYSLALGKGAGS